MTTCVYQLNRKLLGSSRWHNHPTTSSNRRSRSPSRSRRSRPSRSLQCRSLCRRSLYRRSHARDRRSLSYRRSHVRRSRRRSHARSHSRRLEQVVSLTAMFPIFRGRRDGTSPS